VQTCSDMAEPPPRKKKH